MLEKLTEYKNIFIVAIVIGAIGYGVGRYLQPAKIETKVEQVVKEVEVVKKDIVVKERIVKQKDGTEITERTTEDKSTESTSKDSQTKSETVVTNAKPKWLISGGAGLTTNATTAYMASVQYRVLGPFFVGGHAVINPGNNTGLVTLGMEF